MRFDATCVRRARQLHHAPKIAVDALGTIEGNPPARRTFADPLFVLATFDDQRTADDIETQCLARHARNLEADQKGAWPLADVGGDAGALRAHARPPWGLGEELAQDAPGLLAEPDDPLDRIQGILCGRTGP